MSIYVKLLPVEATSCRTTAKREITALAMINQTLDEYLVEQEGAYDRHTHWALAWFDACQANMMCAAQASLPISLGSRSSGRSSCLVG